MTTAYLGEEGFRWFFGKVEDREDPKKIGRVRVRIYNVHPFTNDGKPDTVNVPTTHLPWATPVSSIMSAGIISDKVKDGVGISAVGLMVGSTVFGFFADGNDCQIPVILGSLAGLFGSNEVSELPKPSLGENSVGALKDNKKIQAALPFPGEPTSPYAAKYPYNKAIRTESGHLIEIDDTPSKERIHIMHKTGTYVEVNMSGDVILKSTRNTFDISTSNNNVYVGGNVNMYVKGNMSTHVSGSYSLNVDGAIIINGDTINLNNGSKGAARTGDLVTNDDNAGSQPIAGGSGTVFIGN
jgi:Gp5 N-terminal OB domain